MYYSGEGVEMDKRKAFNYFELAADQGNPHAQFNLGIMYYSGEGVEMDKRKAFNYYKLAADHGHPDALLVIAEIRKGMAF